MGYIYLITNTINGMRYIGQTKHNDINKRWSEHKNFKKSSIGRFLLNAYQKYGIENFKFQIVCICFDEDCNKYESEYITKFNTLSPNGYNLKAGGHFSAHHPETKKLMSESIKKLWQNKEHKEKISNSLKEYYRTHKKVLTEEHKQKLRDAYNKRVVIAPNGKRITKPHGRKPTEKSLQNLKPGACKKTLGKYTEDGILLNTFDSISQAAKENNISHSTISRVCRNVPRCKTAAGFVWKFL
jgi:group I intron endonuclease